MSVRSIYESSRTSLHASLWIPLLVIALSALILVPRAASAACCELVKIDSDPPSTQMRACEPNASGECTTWLFDGSLTEGESTSICSSSGTVLYQELDASTQTYAAPIEARCDAGGRVEL